MGPASWSIDLGSKKSHDVRFSNALRLADSQIRKAQPDLVVVESPIGGKDASALLVGLAACVRGVCANHHVRCEVVFPSTARKHFLGKSKTSRDFPLLSREKAKKAIKQEIMERAILLGWDVPDLDAADACAVWDWACATFAPRYQAKPSGELFA